jgi:hypothetical protein
MPMKIIQISAVSVIDEDRVYGLGEDNQIYFWSQPHGAWEKYGPLTTKTSPITERPSANRTPEPPPPPTGYNDKPTPPVVSPKPIEKTLDPLDPLVIQNDLDINDIPF